MIALIVSTSMVALMGAIVVGTLWLYRWNVRRRVRHANPPTSMRWITIEVGTLGPEPTWLHDDLDWEWPR